MDMRTEREIVDAMPAGDYRLLGHRAEPEMVGRIWRKEAIAYAVVDGFLEPGTMFVHLDLELVAVVCGKQLEAEYLSWIPLARLRGLDRRRALAWRRSCTNRKLRHNSRRRKGDGDGDSLYP